MIIGRSPDSSISCSLPTLMAVAECAIKKYFKYMKYGHTVAGTVSDSNRFPSYRLFKTNNLSPKIVDEDSISLQI